VKEDSRDQRMRSGECCSAHLITAEQYPGWRSDLQILDSSVIRCRAISTCAHSAWWSCNFRAKKNLSVGQTERKFKMINTRCLSISQSFEKDRC